MSSAASWKSERSGPGGDRTRGPAVFALAHHDDEVFCAGHLLRELAEGRSVRILWATAGGLASPARRVAEGARARRLLGLHESAVRDLLLRDQAAWYEVPWISDAVEALAGRGEWDVGDRRRAPVVYVPAFEGGHPDHDAVNLAAAVLRVRRPDLQIREFPLYRRGRAGLGVQSLMRPPGTAADGCRVLELDSAALRLRRGLVRANLSQAAVSVVPLLALARVAGRGRVEESRPLPVHDYARPPQPRPLLYELYTRRRFDEFRRVAGEALAGAREATNPPRARTDGEREGA